MHKGPPYLGEYNEHLQEVPIVTLSESKVTFKQDVGKLNTHLNIDSDHKDQIKMFYFVVFTLSLIVN